MDWKAETIYNVVAPGNTFLIIEPTISGAPPKRLSAGTEIVVEFGSAKPERIKVLNIDYDGADTQSSSGVWRMTPRTANDPPTMGKADWANRQEWVVRRAIELK